MNIKWNINHVNKLPYTVSSCVSGNVKRMIQNITANKKCYISVCLHTKTSLEITMYYDDDEFLVTFIPNGAEKLKFVKNAWQNNDFINKRNTRCFFMLTSRQGLEQLKEYISLVLAEMNLGIDEIEVCMTIRGIEGLKE